MKRSVVVFSDIEMGAGGALDDFLHSAFLGELIEGYTRGRWADGPVDIVFNGDCFDFLKTAVDGAWPYHIDKTRADKKLSSILAAHQDFLEAIDHFIAAAPDRNRVHFVVGNHDAELLFPSIQRALRDACGGHEQIGFPGFELILGPLYLEHGHQYDALFRMDPARPFISRDPEPLLNLSWAAVGLLSLVMPMHPDLYFFDRLQPRRILFELVPELPELFTALTWRYWTKDFWRAFLIEKDPLMRFDWTMAKEVVKRTAFRNADVTLDAPGITARVEQSSQKLHVFGHMHELAHRQLGPRSIIQSGALRDEYFILDGGAAFEPMLKCFLEVELDGDAITAVTTRQLRGPARPKEHMLETVFDMTPYLRSQLDFLGDTRKQVAASKKQERIEAEQAKKRKG